MCEPLVLTLDFGDVDYLQPLLLVLTGWLQYGDASTNIALSQGAAPVVPPTLEALLPCAVPGVRRACPLWSGLVREVNRQTPGFELICRPPNGLRSSRKSTGGH